jgi:hypothetical protein
LFSRTGKDWLLVLLDNTKKSMHQAILLTLWRSWELRNDIYHKNGKSTIDQSVRFLISYANTWNSNPSSTGQLVLTDEKGKTPIIDIDEAGNCKKKKEDERKSCWEPPPHGWLKVNVDGYFIADTEIGSTGVVIRDHSGHAVLAGGAVLTRCSSAEETEAIALLEGARMAKNWTRAPVIF